MPNIYIFTHTCAIFLCYLLHFLSVYFFDVIVFNMLKVIIAFCFVSLCVF